MIFVYGESKSQIHFFRKFEYDIKQWKYHFY